jgi:pectate lyase
VESRAGASGWAAAEGGPEIVGAVRAEHHIDVRSRADFDAAMRLGETPKLLRIHGVVDLAAGRAAKDFADPAFDFEAYCRAYDPQAWGRKRPTGALEEARRRSAARQAASVMARVAPHTRIVGATPYAGFAEGTLLLERTHAVELRNLRFHGVRDHFPAWDPLDGANGEWNSDYDAVSLVGSRRVWVDHCSFRSRHPADRRIFGRPFETNDGLLDITRASDLVTVSWCRFSRHDKTMLIGGNDRHVEDRGKLRVTVHHNFFEDCAERTPRVRFGLVHVANNLYVVSPGAAYGYSIGLGLEARIVSEDNAWETGPEIDSSRLVRPWGGTLLADRGSMHNGRAVSLPAEVKRAHPAVVLEERPAFDPPPVAGRLPVTEVAARVRAGAGAG